MTSIKEIYESPEIETVLFESEDIITSSITFSLDADETALTIW